jgi:hypothetical protein
MAGVRSLLLVLLLTESPVAACSLSSLQFFQPLNTRQTAQTWRKTTRPTPISSSVTLPPTLLQRQAKLALKQSSSTRYKTDLCQKRLSSSSPTSNPARRHNTCIFCGAVPTEAPPILLANGNRPLVQPTGPLAMGPAYGSSYATFHCLVNGLPH